LADAAAVVLAQTRGETARALWQGRAEWRVIPATGGAWEPASPSGWVVEDTLSARLHPRMASAALVAAIQAKGGEVVLGDGAHEGPVIWATGVQGLRDLTADLGRPVGDGVKGQAISLQFDARDAPQLYADSLHIIPHSDGTVAIGSTSETVWDNESGTDGQLETIHARAIAALPVLAGAPVVERWAGIRPRAKSRAPLMGAWPGRAGDYVANGGFKIGFGMAPKVATTMVDLVLEGRDTIPEGFRL
jgi:glycine/D-amino acid oxidase-like deaminating enzyme